MISNIYSLLECVVGGSLAVWGFVSFVNPKSLQQFIRFFTSKENASLIQALYFILLPFGLAIVFAHNEWVFNPSVIVTFIGWGIVTQCILWFVIPGPMRKFGSIKIWVNPIFIRCHGALVFTLGLLILYPYFVV